MLWKTPAPLATAAGFAGLIDTEAARIAQKATIDYCRARSGLNWPRLIEDPAFKQAVEVAQWGALAAVQADLLVVAEGCLRPHAGPAAPRLVEGLAGLWARSLTAHHPPAHVRPDWRVDPEPLRLRLAQAQLAEPKSPTDIGATAGAAIFDLLPIHESLRQLDRETVVASVAFSLIGFRDGFVRRADLPALAAALSG